MRLHESVRTHASLILLCFEKKKRIELHAFVKPQP
jgi:hypothetical protein